MAHLLLAMTFFAAALPADFAGEPAILRIEPPSWWTAARPQAIGLLVEGHDLVGATASSGNASLQVARVEPGLDGRALWIEALIPAQAHPGTVTIEIQAQGQRLSLPWTIAPALAYKPQGFGSDDIIYMLMPDRFADGDPRSNEAGGGDSMLDRASGDAYHGGDFAGIRQHLGYLKGLGVTAIWLAPVYRPEPRWLELKAGGGRRRMAEYHGYAPVDFFDTNPRFGSAQEYRALVDQSHQLGLKVIQDHIAGFTGPRHRWAQSPPFEGWFHGSVANPPVGTLRFDVLADPHSSEVERRGVTDGWFFGLLPDLDTRNPKVKRYAIQQSLWWISNFRADGVRLDTYPFVDREFWRDWSRQLEADFPGLSVVGEAWTAEPWQLCFFQGGRPGWDGIDPGVDSVFDFPLNQAIVQVFSEGAPATRLSAVLARDGLYPRPERLVTFLDNHDTPRLAAAAGVTPARYRLAVAFLLTTRGIPQMTWGDEIGIPGHMDDRRDFPGGFPGDSRNAFEARGRTADEQATFETWRTLIHLRRSSPALCRGRLIELAVADKIYAYLREAQGERMVIALNLDAQPATVRIARDRIESASGCKIAFGSAQIRLEPASLNIELPAESTCVIRLLEPTQ
jgi:glycosidase